MANSITPNPGEQSENPPEHLQKLFETLVKMNSFVPVMICGVSRKINTGNFENIDVYNAVTVPIIYDINSNEWLEFRKAAEEAAKIGFAIASKETNDRYQTVKSNQGGGRPT